MTVVQLSQLGQQLFEKAAGRQRLPGSAAALASLHGRQHRVLLIGAYCQKAALVARLGAFVNAGEALAPGLPIGG